MAEKSFQFCLVTPQGKVIDQPVRYVSVPAHDGLIGFEPGRAPIVFKLGIGSLRVDFAEGGKPGKPAGSHRYFVVEDGFAQMVGNKLTVLTTRALAEEQLTLPEVQKEYAEAMARKPSTPADAEGVRAAQQRARVKLAMAKREHASGI